MALGIDQLPFKMTVKMMIDIARRAINAHSYEELQQIYLHDWGIVISDDQIRYVVNELGRIVFNHDTAVRTAAMSHFDDGAAFSLPVDRRKGVLYIEMDGAMFNTRHATDGSTWRENKLGAVFSNLDIAFSLPVDRRKGVLYIEMDGAMFNTRHATDGSTWRENKLGAVFSNLDIVYRKTKTGREAHRITEREFISYAGDADTFKEHLYAVALKHGLEHAKKVVIISDGAKWIKGFREKFCANLDVVHILDYSHVKENIYKFANVFIRGAKQKTAWAEELARLVKEGKIDEAIAKAEPYKDKRRAGIPNIYSYLSNNRDCINYPSYVAAGYFIGSGVIESGNRSVMQERLKLPGMRWSVESAQFVLTLKCKYDSNLWESVVVPLIYKTYGLKSQ